MNNEIRLVFDIQIMKSTLFDCLRKLRNELQYQYYEYVRSIMHYRLDTKRNAAYHVNCSVIKFQLTSTRYRESRKSCKKLQTVNLPNH